MYFFSITESEGSNKEGGRRTPLEERAAAAQTRRALANAAGWCALAGVWASRLLPLQLLALPCAMDGGRHHSASRTCMRRQRRAARCSACGAQRTRGRQPYHLPFCNRRRGTAGRAVGIRCAAGATAFHSTTAGASTLCVNLRSAARSARRWALRTRRAVGRDEHGGRCRRCACLAAGGLWYARAGRLPAYRFAIPLRAHRATLTGISGARRGGCSSRHCWRADALLTGRAWQQLPRDALHHYSLPRLSNTLGRRYLLSLGDFSSLSAKAHRWADAQAGRRCLRLCVFMPAAGVCGQRDAFATMPAALFSARSPYVMPALLPPFLPVLRALFSISGMTGGTAPFCGRRGRRAATGEKRGDGLGSTVRRC